MGQCRFQGLFKRNLQLSSTRVKVLCVAFRFQDLGVRERSRGTTLKHLQGSGLGAYHVSHSLNSLKGGYIGDYIRDYYRAY